MDSDAAIRRLAHSQDSLVTTAQALSLGMTRADVFTRTRRREWLTLTRGVHLVDADLYTDGLSERTWWRAALLAQGPSAFLVAQTAVRAYGVRGLPANLASVEVAVPGGLSRGDRATTTAELDGGVDGPRIVVRQLVVPATDVVEIGGMRVRTIAHSLVDTALNSDRPTTLSMLDSALHIGVATRDDLDAAIIAARGRRGVVALRDVGSHMDGRAESPLESRVRLACIDGRVAPDELQHPVYDDIGNLIALGDMAWLKWRSRPLIGEADGAAVHSLPSAVFRDRWRSNALTARSYDTIRFTWADAMQPQRIVAAVRSALQAA